MKFSYMQELIKREAFPGRNEKKVLQELFPNLSYHELEMDSSYIDVHEDISYNKDNVFLHSHSFYEILFCQSGNIQYLIGDTRYQLHKNDIVFLPPGTSHCPIFPDHLDEPYKRIVVWVNSDFHSKLQKNIASSIEHENNAFPIIPNIIRISGMSFYQIENLFLQLYAEKKQSLTGTELICIGLYLQLFTYIYRASYTEKSNVAKPEKKMLLDKIISYIENHLSEDLSLQSVSSHFLVSQSSICQLFKKNLDSSFYKVVTQRRLIEAKKLILDDIPLKEVPDKCGFSDYSVFYKAFIKEYGISPKEFRTIENSKR